MDSVVTCLVFAGTVRFLHLSLVHGPDGHIRCLGAEKCESVSRLQSMYRGRPAKV